MWRPLHLLAAFLLLPLPARALTLVDGAATLTLVSGPQDFSIGALESDSEIFVFEESTVLLASDLVVNATLPGTYTASPGTSTIAAGTEVRSYLIHMDVFNTTTHGGGGTPAGTLVFDTPILALIGDAPELDASDAVLGDPTSTYTPAPTARHTWEANDSLTISADGLTLTIDQLRVGSNQPWADQIRVIVVVPEPAAAALLAPVLLLAARRTRFSRA